MSKTVNKKKKSTKKSKPVSEDTFHGPTSHLVPPECNEIYRKIMMDQIPADETIRYSNMPEYRFSDVLDFIKSCYDFRELHKLLRHNPNLIRHPIVWGSLQYVQSVRSGYPEEFMEEECEFALNQIVSGWVEGMLPGATLKAPRKKRGRKVPWDERQWRMWLHSEYKELLAALRKNISGLKEGRVKEAWFQYLYQAIVESYREVFNPNFAIQMSYMDEPFHPHTPPTREIVQQWLNEQYDKDGNPKFVLGGDTFRDFFAYRLLSYEYKKYTPGQIKGYIQKYRKDSKRAGNDPDA